MVQQGIVSVTSCNAGDVVLVVWDTVHGNYAVYQESSTLYFLHSDYVDALDIEMNPNSSRRCVLAEVIDKEYCHARKVRLFDYLLFFKFGYIKKKLFFGIIKNFFLSPA
jgi:hypothetical protein